MYSVCLTINNARRRLFGIGPSETCRNDTEIAVPDIHHLLVGFLDERYVPSVPRQLSWKERASKSWDELMVKVNMKKSTAAAEGIVSPPVELKNLYTLHIASDPLRKTFFLNMLKVRGGRVCARYCDL